MPGTVGEIPAAKVQILCTELEELLKPPILSDEERAELHAHDVELTERTKDDWWKRYAEVKSYARRKEFDPWTFANVPVDEGLVLSVQSNDPVEVMLVSGDLQLVYPASLDRVRLVEDLDYWHSHLEAAVQTVKAVEDAVDMPGSHLLELRKEQSDTVALLFMQVCAPGQEPLPLDVEIEPWARALTRLDQVRLTEAWREVNIDRPKDAEAEIKRKYPLKKKRGGADDAEVPGTLGGLAFLYASVAYREKKSPAYIQRNRSLAEVMTTYMINGLQTAHAREQAKREAKKNQK